MDEESRRALDRRLSRVEGQVRGLRRMVESGEYCSDVLIQLAAARAALDQVGAELAVSHVRTCIVGRGTETQHDRAKAMTDEELFDELRSTISRLVR